MQTIQQIMAMTNDLGKLSDISVPMSYKEYEQQRVDTYNSLQGENKEKSILFDLYDCEICKNRMKIAFLDEYEEFSFKKCECVKKRITLLNFKKSGLTEELKTKTFETFKAVEEWQKNFKNKALDYTQSAENEWFFAGGQSGAGKTHLCTAICNYYLNEGKTVKYILWREIAQKLKACEYNDIARENIFTEIKNADVLYIDDFLKSSKPENEINYAFEIINSRYISRKRTIISSEMTIKDINNIDSATGGRIFAQSRKFMIQISKDFNKNYRYR